MVPKVVHNNKVRLIGVYYSQSVIAFPSYSSTHNLYSEKEGSKQIKYCKSPLILCASSLPLKLP